MDKGFFFEIATSKPELFIAIIEFNCKLLYEAMVQASDEMSSFGQSIGGFDIEAIQKLALWGIETRKDRFLESGYCFWDFQDEMYRLALLDYEVIEQLQLVFGAAIHAEEIAKVVQREEVLQLEELLGKDIYEYALQRARYQLGSVREFFFKSAQSHSLAERILYHGKLAVYVCASSWPEVLKERIVRFEKDFSLQAEDEEVFFGEFSYSIVQGIWFALKKILLREVAPQWKPCFD